MKKLIPPTWRVALRLWQRYSYYGLTGRWQQFAKVQAQPPAPSLFLPQLLLTQPLGSMSAHYLAHKKHNLALALQPLQAVVILPGQIFSFWHAIGKPSARAGYLEGRTITGQTLGVSVGGGLCLP